jgi:glutathione S-transferase
MRRQLDCAGVFEEGIMGLKLHDHPLSTFSRRVLIAFAEKQVPHELAVVDMAARQHRAHPY